jgi:hypothetical protein
MKTKQTIPFEEWYDRLALLAEAESWDIGPAKYAPLWVDYYDDGDSPEDALRDDMRAGRITVPYYGD